MKSKAPTIILSLFLLLNGSCQQKKSDTIQKPWYNQSVSEMAVTVGDVNFEMVKVEAGNFVMGCVGNQYGECFGNESPCHYVSITQDYYIGKYEVTQELYEAVMGTNPSYRKGHDLPVENVSWNDAQEFCAELSRMTGRRFSLPTEAEWEYAARGGVNSIGDKYSGSSGIEEVAWYTYNSKGQTHAVGHLLPNKLGIYDMSGNVWEWCQDWYGNYCDEKQVDPSGLDTGAYRVLRGGSWASSARNCRVTMRSMNTPDYRYRVFGFRIVLH